MATLESAEAGVHAVFHGSDTFHLARAAVERLIESPRETAANA